MKKNARTPLQKFHAVWIQQLETLRLNATKLSRQYFPRFDPDEILNETYLKLRNRIQRAMGSPLDWDQLLGYIHVAMRNVLNDLLRQTQRQKELQKRYTQQAIDRQSLNCSTVKPPSRST